VCDQLNVVLTEVLAVVDGDGRLHNNNRLMAIFAGQSGRAGIPEMTKHVEPHFSGTA